MDQFLADLYGTNEPEEADFEKVAHLDFLEKVAEEEGIDLNDLSDEDLGELAEIAAEALDEVEGEEGYEDEGEESYEEGDDLEKEAEAKVEEADFLGRVMAHSFNQELDNIEKEAGYGWQAAKGKARETYSAAKGVGREAFGRGRRAGRQAYREGSKAYGRGAKAVRKSPLGRFGEASTVGGRMKQRLRSAGRSVDKSVRGLGRRLGAPTQAAGAKSGYKAGRGEAAKGMRARGRQILTGERVRSGVKGARSGRAAALKSQRRRGYGAMGAAGLGLAGAGAGAAYAGREKKSADEQWDEAIQARAWEHLMAAGLADNEGNFIPAENLDLGKTASDEDVEYHLDADALELLEAEGYPVEWY